MEYCGEYPENHDKRHSHDHCYEIADVFPQNGAGDRAYKRCTSVEMLDEDKRSISRKQIP